MIRKTLLAGLLVSICGLFLASCVVYPRHHRAVVVVGPPVEYGYQPLLYNGYVVYYNDDGIPFYWNAGVRIWVPVSYRDRYIGHWRSHRSAYRSWYKHRGHHYRDRHYRRDRDRHRSGHRNDRPGLKPARRDDRRPPGVRPVRRAKDTRDAPRLKKARSTKKKKKKKKKSRD